MRNILLVIKQEVSSLLSRPSFWIMAVIFPVLIVFLNVGVQVITARSLRSVETALPQEAPAGPGGPASRTGYVDAAGLIDTLPPSVHPAALQAFPDEAAARAAIAGGRIERYAVIASDYLRTGHILIVQRNYRPLDDTAAQLLHYVITYNLAGDEDLASALAEPLGAVTMESLAPEPKQTGPAASYVATATLFIFFFLISTSSGLMLQSVSREKENRVVEVLLLSVPPRELMLGKVLGLSVVALLQMSIWVGVPLLLLRGNSPSQALAALGASLSLPPGFALWALLYFALGYLLYASLMAAVGALAPNARAGGQVTIVVLLPLMAPLLVNTAFVQAPNGLLATALSLFPLTAPTAMVTRLATVSVPPWQLGASILGLGATTYLLVLLSARFFRAETLLSDVGLSWGRIVDEFRRVR